MKQFAALVLLMACVVLVGCGGSNSANPATINGNWNASLTEANNQAYGTMGMSLVVNNDGSLSVTNLNLAILAPSPCFDGGTTTTGSFGLSGNFNGNVMGTFGLVVKSVGSATDTLTLNGSANGNTITGNWTLNGQFPGCTSGNGTFMMTRA
jgi:hypothetical protein